MTWVDLCRAARAAAEEEGRMGGAGPLTELALAIGRGEIGGGGGRGERERVRMLSGGPIGGPAHARLLAMIVVWYR